MGASTPAGVKLIAALTAIYGLLWLIAGGMWATDSTGLGPAPIYFVVAIAIVAVAAGLWTLDPFAWMLAVGLYGFGVTWTAVQALGGDPGQLPCGIVGVVLLGYLFVVRARFL